MTRVQDYKLMTVNVYFTVNLEETYNTRKFVGTNEEILSIMENLSNAYNRVELVGIESVEKA